MLSGETSNPFIAINCAAIPENLFTAIGAAICMDLPGQVVSETLGCRQITGAEGALDFARTSGMGNGRSSSAKTSVAPPGHRGQLMLIALESKLI